MCLQLFEEMDVDNSGKLEANEVRPHEHLLLDICWLVGSGLTVECVRVQVAELYKKARGTKLSKAKLQAAMAEMDADGNGEVELSEFQEWWAANGGDLEQQRGRAWTLVFQSGLELLLVAPQLATKRAWLAQCAHMIRSDDSVL